MPHLPHAQPEEIGLDAKYLQVAYDLLDEWTGGNDPSIPGGAILVGRRGKVVGPRWFGRQGPEPQAEAIRPDGMFLLASISKPITYLGAMLLVQRGELHLSDLVTRYVPEFAAHHKEDVRGKKMQIVDCPQRSCRSIPRMSCRIRCRKGEHSE